MLPEHGWGRIDVVEADISFDEPGEPKTGARSVPIPPVLVDMLKSWVDERQLAIDALLFRTRTGKLPQRSNWARAWQRALRQTGQSRLRVYDCRHAAATTWLRPVPLLARWPGGSGTASRHLCPHTSERWPKTKDWPRVAVSKPTVSWSVTL